MRAQKRAKVAAVRFATNSSEFFTQDLEELSLYSSTVNVPVAEVNGGTSLPRTAKKQIQSERLAKILNDYGIKDSNARKAIATRYLGDRKALEVPESEFQDILNQLTSELSTNLTLPTT
jgi:hypothetical protein